MADTGDMARLSRDGKEVKRNVLLTWQWLIFVSSQDYRPEIEGMKELKQKMTADQIIQADTKAKELQKRIKD